MPYAREIVRPINQVICLIILLLVATAIFNRATAQGLSACSWPFEVTGQGFTNIATPDTNATYWIMPLDTSQWPTMIINGEYPRARFFNFVSYLATGGVVDSIIDADIAPDRGSTNPFAVAAAPEPHNYTIKITRTGLGAANVLKLGEGWLAFIVYRVYVPDRGLDRNGGVLLPAVTLIATDGTAVPLQPCPFAAADSSAGNLITSLQASSFTDGADFMQKHVGIGLRTARQTRARATLNPRGLRSPSQSAAPQEVFSRIRPPLT